MIEKAAVEGDGLDAWRKFGKAFSGEWGIFCEVLVLPALHASTLESYKC